MTRINNDYETDKDIALAQIMHYTKRYEGSK
jgi:hypothetical protein